MLNRKVTLVRVRVNKVFLYVQCEWQDWSETREGLVIKALATELVVEHQLPPRVSATPAGQTW